MLRESVTRHLAVDQFVARELIFVDIEGEEIILSGAVPSYFQKQMAQHAVRRVAGNFRIRNALKVVSG